MANVPYSKNNDLIFKDALSARNSITKRQEREIRKLYNEWAREVREQARTLSKIPGTVTEQRELAQLYYQLRSASKQLTTEINSSVEKNVTYMGDVVSRVNKQWLKSLGISPDAIDRKFAYSKDVAIRNILTGNIYENGYTLSSRIWKLTDSNVSDIYNIISRGVAENQSVYNIAKQIEKYVNPDARFPYRIQSWTNPLTGRVEFTHIKNRTVDYNAQRLARTTIQHAYQQTIVSLTKDNPFVHGYIWHADGSHPCPVCSERDGHFYTDVSIPLDHPNGQCSIEPAIDMADVIDTVGSYQEGVEVAEELREFFESLDFRPW